ncbi:MAG: N-acetyl sugar amidotransferase [Synergistaceae bacterium]|nr:N-acetyl sugar amidotransferase [Synergistaceae bacterium]
MKQYPRHIDIDYSKYAPDIPPDKLEAKFGLPREVTFCKECVMTNQRPTSCFEFEHTARTAKKSLRINDDGICDACLTAKSKDKGIDWKEREGELIELCDRFRRSDGKYDCLVPGSGGKDSFYAAHTLKYKYGMHPLTVTWAPNMYTPWGWHNLQSWIGAGFDNYLCTPNALTHRLVTRLAVENIFHPFQAFILGQKQLAPKIAVKFGIPLVFYGENETEYGNPLADGKSAQRDLKYFSTNDKNNIYLGGVSLRDLESEFGVSQTDLSIYLPGETSDFTEHGIEVHYLGYYLKWHPQGSYYYSVEHGGFQPSPERTPGTYSKYNSIDDKIDDHHYYTTYIKYGIGRCTYDASQEVRNKEITHDEAVLLTKKFDGEYPLRFEREIFNYLSLPEKQFPVASRMFEQPVMDREYFLHLADRFRSPHIWKRVGDEWKLRHTPFEGESGVNYGAPQGA